MLSRVADSVYWMNRYIERAENVARFVQVNLNLMLDNPIEVVEHQWKPLVDASGDTKDFEERYSAADEESVIRFLTFDKKNPNSILSCLISARENGRTIRDTISSEMWEHLNNFYLMVSKESRKRKIDDLQSFFTEVKKASHLFVGLSDTTMSHGEAWHFGRLGRLFERADKTTRILDVKYFILLPGTEYVDTPLDEVVWGALLKSVSAFEMYRKKYQRITYKNVADFLLFDETFPRSVFYCIRLAENSISIITKGMEKKPFASIELEKLKQFISSTNIEDITQGGLHEFVDTFQFNLNVVGQEIYKSFIATKEI